MPLFARLIGVILFLQCLWVSAETLHFTAIPDQDESRLQARFDQVARYLSETLEVDVAYVPVKSYAAAVTAFRNDEVQLAWFGGLSGVQARRQTPGARAIAQGREDQTFRTYFIANRSTGLQPTDGFPKEIVQHTFTFGSKGSTSGRLMPEYFIRKHLEATPDEAFRRVGFSGDHTRTIALVQSGAWEVGAVNFKVWDSQLASGHIDPEKIQVIWKTPPYPDYQWTIRGDVDRTWGNGFAGRVQQALLDMDSPPLLAAFPRSGFVEASNQDYEPIEKTARAIGLLP